MKLPERIFMWRTAANLTMQALADKVGVTSAAVSQWEEEKDGTTPTTQNLEKIAAACGVSMSIFWSDSPGSVKRHRAS